MIESNETWMRRRMRVINESRERLLLNDWMGANVWVLVGLFFFRHLEVYRDFEPAGLVSRSEWGRAILVLRQLLESRTFQSPSEIARFIIRAWTREEYSMRDCKRHALPLDLLSFWTMFSAHNIGDAHK
jgi:hypothetical protein